MYQDLPRPEDRRTPRRPGAPGIRPRLPSLELRGSCRLSRVARGATARARRRASSPQQACSRKAVLALFSSFSAESYTRSIFCQRSGSIQALPAQLATQPILGQLPVAHHCVAGNLQDLSRFLQIETTEKTQLHHLALARIHLCQSFKRLIQVGEIQTRRFPSLQSLVQAKQRDLSASL